LAADLRTDPLSGRQVAIAPSRANRPGAARARPEPPTPDELDTCPFCEGREERTPPETLALGRAVREPDTPGWRVRVVPNLYPALDRQEVVISSPRHIRSIVELADDELGLIAEAWHERADDAYVTGLRWTLAFFNEGRPAGASLPHSHSQLACFAEAPPTLSTEASRLTREDCALCRLLDQELADGSRVVAERHGVHAVAALAGRSPYELLIAPREHSPSGFDGGDFLVAALVLARDAVATIQEVEGDVPFNLVLHSFPGDGHWHLELIPRLSLLAGLELGAGVYVNTLSPEEAADRLSRAG
jgi:UDPglucose--hexose-1-phosphate uridylyltransferase